MDIETLSAHLGRVKVPNSSDKVYKDECVFSFDNPEFESGLYVNLTTFLGLGRDHIEGYTQHTGNKLYLHMHRERKEVAPDQLGDGPEKKITRLAIGVEGGFDPNIDKGKFEYTDYYSVVLVPEFLTIKWPNQDLPEIIKQSVQGILDAQSATKLAELESLSGTWDGEARLVSKHSHTLQQLNNGKKIPPSNWKCEKCDLTSNLWLNLSDGSILCGRKFFDGTGGNDHAVEHYKAYGYPLAVKLGTITKEGKGDVFSYDEDDMVEDVNLKQHLAHFGINITDLEKTEKSMVELELDLNQRVGEWGALTESSNALKPVYGPGYTGLRNLGNSCYLNSVMQVLFTIPDFILRFVNDAPRIFSTFPLHPADDFNVQMAKLGTGLLSGRYSLPPSGSHENPGIAPNMFKNLIGKNHPDFSSKKQQDAQEYLLHFINILERNSRNNVNPADALRFTVEDRVQCMASQKVKYTTRDDWCLPLPIPLDAAINKEEVAEYERCKMEAEKCGLRTDPALTVRPKIKLSSCLEAFSRVEIVDQYYSTAVNAKTTAAKTCRLATMPDYLFLHLKKFTLREDWVPVKLDVAVEMPDILDLSQLRGNGLQPGEVLLPELTGPPPPMPPMDEGVMAQLVEMGFPFEAVKRAMFFTKNSGLEAATNWMMEHMADSDFADPFVPPGLDRKSDNSFVPNDEALSMIMGMGFTRDQAIKALKATDNNIERAADWIFSHAGELDSMEDDFSANQGSEGACNSGVSKCRDGPAKYQLVAFISHMGTSSMVGHYVAHILKDDRWVIFNDEKVALSVNPPKELGYLYLYKRL
ncbi:ubiquitin carboxyl-terminal hydrolase 5 isoform X1 [Ctenocephalides felis]|uniref:ubiquitin carboxyl-terminal hydrolase 5 isoform X1 n=1 Tax=Ctenocephalides felis TaxID=7515 RepID=UPI000E6E2204|nr:ubiquitin carboxyl-terminal hydrolase 5 isoform X1 [Ctenocephalides felis]